MLLITFSFPVLLNNTVSSRTNHFIISVSFFHFNAGYRHVLKIYIDIYIYIDSKPESYRVIARPVGNPRARLAAIFLDIPRGCA